MARRSYDKPFKIATVKLVLENNMTVADISKEECLTYIHAKLKGTVCTQTVFEGAAIKAVLNATDGTPRLINKLCNDCIRLIPQRHSFALSV